MFDDDPKAASDADALILAALLRLAVKSEGKLAVQDELGKIRLDLLTDRKYADPFWARIRQIKEAASLE